MLEWPKSRHGSIHLHGHQHNRFEYNIQMKEQGINGNDYFPVSLNRILEFMEMEK